MLFLLSFRTNNPVLLHLMLFLSNCLQEEANLKLLLLISQEGVDMLQTFVRSLTFSLEPQPTSKWLREMAFLTQVRLGRDCRWSVGFFFIFLISMCMKYTSVLEVVGFGFSDPGEACKALQYTIYPLPPVPSEQTS